MLLAGESGVMSSIASFSAMPVAAYLSRISSWDTGLCLAPFPVDLPFCAV